MTTNQVQGRSDWAPVARDSFGHYWHLRQRPVRSEWNFVQCGHCGLHMTDWNLVNPCQGQRPDLAYLFEKLVAPTDENEEEPFVND